MNKVFWLMVIGLVFLIIGFKYMFFDYDLLLKNDFFKILTYTLIGSGSFLFGRYGTEFYYEK